MEAIDPIKELNNKLERESRLMTPHERYLKFPIALDFNCHKKANILGWSV
jgi:hypothetical protein